MASRGKIVSAEPLLLPMMTHEPLPGQQSPMLLEKRKKDKKAIIVHSYYNLFSLWLKHVFPKGTSG